MARKKIKDELLDHNYDGIQELDNDLPPWWLYMFYFTIAFSIVYMMYYHVLGLGDLQYAEYEKEMAAAKAAQQQVAASAGPAVALTPFTDEENLAKGKEIYMTNCMACHGANGEGGVGPNLTDQYWLHGGAFENIVKTITDGVPAKGMIAWKAILNPEQIRQVASYVKTLQGTNPPNAKAPQGELYTGE